MNNKLIDLQILTPNGFKNFSGLQRLEKDCIELKFGNSKILDVVVSTDHIFFVDGEPVVSSVLLRGDCLTHKEYGNVTITEIEHIGIQYVYDPLEVDGDNTYYSGGLISHNCSFIGSTATLIAAEYLESMSISGPTLLKHNTLLKVYKEPVRGTKYVLGIDVAEGVGGDSSVIQVLSIDKNRRMEQVATYSNNLIKPYDFAQVCIGISDYYLGAEMMIENNNVGQVLLTTIWYDYDVDRIINTDTKKGRRELGIRATSRTKSAGTTNLKRCIENGWLRVVDQATIEELGKFEEVRPGIFKCGDETAHDDHVMSLLWGAYYIETKYYDPNDSDIEKKIDEEYVLTSAIFEDDFSSPPPSPINPYGNLDNGYDGHGGDYGSYGDYGDVYGTPNTDSHNPSNFY